MQRILLAAVSLLAAVLTAHADDAILVFQVARRTGVAGGQIGPAGDLDVPRPDEDPASYRAQGLPLDSLGEGFVLGALHLLQAAGGDDGEGRAQGVGGLRGTGDQLVSVVGLRAHGVLQRVPRPEYPARDTVEPGREPRGTRGVPCVRQAVAVHG